MNYNPIVTIYLLLSLYLVFKPVTGTSNGLTLELLIHSSSNFSNKVQHSGQNVLSPEVIQNEFVYMVKIGIGTLTSQSTKPLKEYVLHVDTRSPLSWLQCEGCKKSCFKQQDKRFPMNSSKSYHPIPVLDKLCLTKQRNGKHCSYKIQYEKNSYSAGILATETLFLCMPNSDSCTSFEGQVFGCGMDQKQMVYGERARNIIAGVLGLGRGPLSFVSQIDSISDGKFSHCFPPFHEIGCKKRKTHLKFGADAVSPKPNQMSTKLHVIGRSPFYYVELDGISFNGRRLTKIKKGVFRVKHDEAGVIINSRVTFTQLTRPAYDVLLKELDSHFIKKLKYVEKGEYAQRCYLRPQNLKRHRIPTVTFHFKGLSSPASSDLVLKPNALFSDLSDDFICLGIYTNWNDNTTIIGAQLMVNHWFTFDTKNNVLSFHPEDCIANG